MYDVHLGLMGKRIRRIATKLHDGCLCTVHWTAVLLKLTWFPVSVNIRNVEYIDDRKFIEIYVCQKLLVLIGLFSLDVIRLRRYGRKYTARQKTAPFYFCNNFVESFLI